MSDRFGKFVVYVEQPEGLKTPICIKGTEADARGEVHEIAMLPNKRHDVNYVEIPMNVRTLARLKRDNPSADLRFNIGDWGNSDYAAFDLYMDALDRGLTNCS